MPLTLNPFGIVRTSIFLLLISVCRSSIELPSITSNSLEESLNPFQNDNTDCNNGSCVELVCMESKVRDFLGKALSYVQLETSMMTSSQSDLNLESTVNFNSLQSHHGDWLFKIMINGGAELQFEIKITYTPTYSSRYLEDPKYYFTYDAQWTAVTSGSDINLIDLQLSTPQKLQGDHQLRFYFRRVLIDRSMSAEITDNIEFKFIINSIRVSPVVTSNVVCEKKPSIESVKNEPTAALDLVYAAFPQIENLMKDDRYADLTIKSGGEEFKVHRAILANSSPVFATLIFNKTYDKNESLLDLGEKIGSDTVEEIIRYIYTGKVEDIDEIADSLILAAYTYDYPELKALCELALLKQVGTINAFVMYSLAMEVKADRLRQAAFKVMKENKSKIVNHTEEFRKLAVHHPEIMYELFLTN